MVQDVIMREMGPKKGAGVGPAEHAGNGTTRVLFSLTAKRESGHDIPISDRARSRRRGKATRGASSCGAIAAAFSSVPSWFK
jgi:hypothetical protein